MVLIEEIEEADESEQRREEELQRRQDEEFERQRRQEEEERKALKEFQEEQKKREQEQKSSDQLADELKELGSTRFRDKDMAGAIEMWTQAIQLQPGNHIHFSNRSAARLQLKDWENALEDCEQVIQLCPTFIKGYFRKATALLYLNRLDEAEKAIALANPSGTDKACLQLAAQISAAKQEASKKNRPPVHYNTEKAPAPLSKPDEPPKPIDPEVLEKAAKRVEEELEQLRKEKEKDDVFVEMLNDSELADKRLKEKHGRELEKMSAADGRELTEQVKRRIEAEQIRQKQDAAKFRAVAQHMDYEGFKQLVAGATLKPMAKTESVWSMTEDGSVPLNRGLQGVGTSTIDSDSDSTLENGAPSSSTALLCASEFLSAWKLAQSDKSDSGVSKGYNLLTKLDTAEIKRIFPSEVDPELFSAIISCLGKYAAQQHQADEKEKSHLLALLAAVAECPRFDLAMMFLSGEEKKHVTRFFDWASESAQVRKLYKL